MEGQLHPSSCCRACWLLPLVPLLAVLQVLLLLLLLAVRRPVLYCWALPRQQLQLGCSALLHQQPLPPQQPQPAACWPLLAYLYRACCPCFSPLGLASPVRSYSELPLHTHKHRNTAVTRALDVALDQHKIWFTHEREHNQVQGRKDRVRASTGRRLPAAHSEGRHAGSHISTSATKTCESTSEEMQ